jgi:hypothetical protein
MSTQRPVIAAAPSGVENTSDVLMAANGILTISPGGGAINFNG